MKYGLCIFLFMSIGFAAFSQKSLQVTFTRFGMLKKYEVFVRQGLEYKLKGDRRFRKNIIANLQDSLIVFTNDSVIRLNQVKCLRLRSNNYHSRLFQTIFTIGAVGYPLLNIANHGIRQESPLLDQQAIIVSASFAAAALVARQLRFRRIRMSPSKNLKIVDVNYQKLNEK